MDETARARFVTAVGDWYALGEGISRPDRVVSGWQRAEASDTVRITVDEGVDGYIHAGIMIADTEGRELRAFVPLNTPIGGGDTFTFRPVDLLHTDWG